MAVWSCLAADLWLSDQPWLQQRLPDLVGCLMEHGCGDFDDLAV
jgi:hypothetical protein